MLEVNILLIFMIIGAIIALEVKDLLSSVVAVGASGLALSISFLILKAPDLAITQLVVEILCLVILIRATIKKDLPFSTSGRWLFNTVTTFIFLVLFLSLGWWILKDLPPLGEPILKVSSYYLKSGLGKTGAANLVASVVLNFRAYDTLGEATVLFTAAIGVLAVMRRRGRKEIEELEKKDEL
jgi:multisubunit Na+/H+ antiporter MnhB subunit